MVWIRLGWERDSGMGGGWGGGMRLGCERDPGMGWGGDEAEMGEESRYGLRWV